jgi:hypothetical protein
MHIFRPPSFKLVSAPRPPSPKLSISESLSTESSTPEVALAARVVIDVVAVTVLDVETGFFGVFGTFLTFLDLFHYLCK